MKNRNKSLLGLIHQNEVISYRNGIKVLKGKDDYFVNSDNSFITLGSFKTLEEAETFADTKRK